MYKHVVNLFKQITNLFEQITNLFVHIVKKYFYACPLRGSVVFHWQTYNVCIVYVCMYVYVYNSGGQTNRAKKQWRVLAAGFSQARPTSYLLT